MIVACADTLLATSFFTLSTISTLEFFTTTSLALITELSSDTVISLLSSFAESSSLEVAFSIISISLAFSSIEIPCLLATSVFAIFFNSLSFSNFSR